MLLSPRVTRRVVASVLGSAAIAGALGLAAPANADQPNCTAGDYAQIAAGVSAGTSVYLFTHPDVNAFFTSLEGLSRDEAKSQIESYMAANPVVQAELGGIRQPLVDQRNRCGDRDGDGLADY